MNQHFSLDKPTIRPFLVTHRMIVMIAVPMTFAAITTPLLGLVDMGVVGQFGDAELIGGLAIGALVFDFLLTVFSFLRTGTTGLVAQAMGREDRLEELAIFWRAVIIAIIAGCLMIACLPLILQTTEWFMQPTSAIFAAMSTYVSIRILSAPFALLNYSVLGLLLGRGEGLLGLVLQLILNGINIALSIYFGLVLEWGIAGVAWGTFSGELITAILGVGFIFIRARQGQQPDLKRILNGAALLYMVAVNRDILLRSFLLLTAFAFFTRSSTEMGTVTLAANSVLLNFFLVVGFFLDGMAMAVEQITGRAIGAHYAPAFKRGAKLTFLWGMVMSVIVSSFLLLFGDQIIHLLAKSDDVYHMAVDYLPWAVLTGLTGVLAFHMDGVYIGATWTKDMRNMMFWSLLFFFAVLYIAQPMMGNHGLWLALNLFLSVRGITLLAMLPRRYRLHFKS
jgi:MATE family multidrug resistance protein